MSNAPSASTRRVLDALAERGLEPRDDGPGWLAFCPSHEMPPGGHTPSLFVGQGADGHTLVKCRSQNCSSAAILSPLGLRVRDLFAPLTVEQVAAAKQLPEDFLRSLGVRDGVLDGRRGVAIPYQDAQGGVQFERLRLRLAKEIDKRGKERPRFWQPRGVRLALYGLERLGSASGQNLYVVEGESDCWSLWHHGYKAIGVPGAANTSLLTYDVLCQYRHIHGIGGDPATRVYVVAEDDDAGREFAHAAVRDVRASCQRAYDDHRYEDVPHIPMKIIHMPAGTKDVNALHCADPDGFEVAWERLVAAAEDPDKISGRYESDPVGAETTAPAFPVEVLPRKAAEYVRQAAAAHEIPPDFVGVAMLAVAGAAGGREAVRVKSGWLEQPTGYYALIAPPGEGKSPALRRVLRPVYDHQKKLNERFAEDRLRYDEEEATYQQEAKKRRQEGERPKKPTPPIHMRVVADDTTVEALGAILKDNPQGIIVAQDELAQWTRGQNQYKKSGTDRQFYLKAWSGESHIVDRKTDRQFYFIERPLLTVIGGLQPTILSELTDERGREDGFIHRVLFSFPEPAPARPWSNATVAHDLQAAWAAALEVLLPEPPPYDPWREPDDAAAFRPTEVPFTNMARAVWVAWYDAHSEGLNARDLPASLSGPWKKMRSYCARLALAIHQLRRGYRETETATVEAVDVAAAADLIDAYFKPHARKVYKHLHADETEQQTGKVLTWLRKHGGRGTVRELLRAHLAKTAEQADAAFAELERRGAGRRAEEHGPGGKRVSFMLTDPG